MSEIDPIPVPSPAEQTDKRPSQSVMTKKRYHDIEATLTRALSDLDLDDAAREQKVAIMMGGIREIMKFDPERKLYTPEMGKKILAYRKKKAEDAGVSMYEAFKGSEYYQKNKETLNKRNSDYKRNRKVYTGEKE